MALYIDREAVINFLENHKAISKQTNVMLAADEDAIIKFLREKFNPVDVVEVRHGEWLPQMLLGEETWDCSECKTLGSPLWKWCPVCGAKMDGGNK